MAGPELVVKVGANIEGLRREMTQAKVTLETFQSAADKAGGRLMDLGNQSQTAAPKIGGLSASLKQFDGALAAMGIHIGPEIKALGELGAVSGKSAGQLGMVATAGLALAVGIGAWKIGRAAMEFLELDGAVQKAWTSLGLFGDAAAEAAGAKADVLARASKHAGHEITSLTEAMKINAAAAAAQSLAFGKTANAAHDTMVAVSGWQRELRQVRADGNIEQLTKDLASQDFTLKALSTKYGVSVEALGYFQRAQKAAADETKRAGDESKKAADAVEALAKAYQKLMSDANNAAGLAQMEAGAAAIKRAADNAEGIWLMEHEAAKLAHAATEQARLETEAFGTALLAEAVADDTARNARAAGNAELGRTPAAAQAAANSVNTLTDAFRRADGVIVQSIEHANRVGDRMLTEAYTRAGFIPAASFTSGAQRTVGQSPFQNQVQRRAEGGPVAAGSPYMVGERGPELFVPRSAGAIVPNGVGGVQVSITINGSVLGNKHEIARVVGDAVMQSLRGAGVRLPVAT